MIQQENAMREGPPRNENEIARRELVQRTFFAGPLRQAPADMYSRVEQGAATRERDRLTLEPQTTVSTNTYFGRFAATYWQRWTTATEVVIDAVAEGSGHLSIEASDCAGDTRTVATTSVTAPSELPVRLRARIDRFFDGGALWLEAATSTGSLTVQQVRWSVPGVPPRDRRSSVVICTYNRPGFCVETLRTLAGDRETLDHLDAVYVVDQGDDTVAAQDPFSDVQRQFGTKLHYIRQSNLGGAGGFTRGLYEISEVERAHDTHVLFMDDDISLEPDTVVRVTKFANHTAEPTMVGGQMLCELHPDQLLADAEDIEPNTIRAGAPATEELVRASMLDRQQDLRVESAYNAWWCCLVPSEVVATIGLPLPLFFQWDDVEYGLRARAAGYRTVTLPGAAVWHSDFLWKNWDDWCRYFHFRNGLIVIALHSDFDVGAITTFMLKELTRYLLSMQYGMAATLIKAVEDFLRGPEALTDGGVEAAATIRKLRAEFSETLCHPDPEASGAPLAALPLVADRGAPSLPRAVAAKRFVWQLTNKSRPGAFIAARDANWWHISLFRTAIVTDPSQQGVRVHRLDRELMLRLARRGFRTLWQFRTRARRAQRQYRSTVPRLAIPGAWKRLFDLP